MLHRSDRRKGMKLRSAMNELSAFQHLWVVFSLLSTAFNLFIVADSLNSCDKSRVVLTNTSGKISDGPPGFNYTQNSHCEWLIQPNVTESVYISLQFQQLATECAYDYVFVYDGPSMASGRLLGSFSGLMIPPPSRLLAESGSMLVVLFSDTNYVMQGFQAEYRVHRCPHNCSQHGQCLGSVCQCRENFTGKDCSVYLCPDDCGAYQGRGHCTNTTLGCQCRPGFAGDDCSLENNNYVGKTWHFLSRNGVFFKGKAGHASAYDAQRDVAYFYGGYDLNEVLGDLQAYDFNRGGFWTDFSRVKRHDDGEEVKPPPLYHHAMVAVGDGFLLFGGTDQHQKPRNDLWFFDFETRLWQREARNSTLVPDPVSKHSMTVAGDEVYVFGGSLAHGKFSYKMYKIDAKNRSQWLEVRPLGGKSFDLRLTGHSVVFHRELNALLLFGGIRTDVARFSRLSHRLYIFDLETRVWSELESPSKGPFRPPERAFHTAHVIGDYMVVFGGYSHRHNQIEVCYDHKLYFYHLGCHAWVLERRPFDGNYPLDHGVFGHAAVVRKNMLVVSGGFQGSVSDAVLVYTMPYALALKNNSAVCAHYGSRVECSSNPQCGWCPTDGLCYLRSSTRNCTANLQTRSCPGICAALNNCQSCAALSQCAWCSDACHSKRSNRCPSGTSCLSRTQSGLTLIQYRNPPDFSAPDDVQIVNTTKRFLRPLDSNRGPFQVPTQHQFAARMLGSIRVPLNAADPKNNTLHVCAPQSNLVFKARNDGSEEWRVLRRTEATASNTFHGCKAPLPLELGPPGTEIGIDFLIERNLTRRIRLNAQSTAMFMLLGRNGRMTERSVPRNYLLPFKSNNGCHRDDNCLKCVANTNCAWNRAAARCDTRSNSSALNLIRAQDCVRCSEHVYCEDCVNEKDQRCAWLEDPFADEARCVRRGRFAHAVSSRGRCPAACHRRSSCESCVNGGGNCVWCEATQECFLFSVYTSQFMYGKCYQWIDKNRQLHHSSSAATADYLAARAREQCQPCELFESCDTCVLRLGCGWLYRDPADPTRGTCVRGDFRRPAAEVAVNGTWSYAECPDVNECALGLDDCHEHAECINRQGTYACHCRRGYVGDGRQTCDRTCLETCEHGTCSGSPDFRCLCELGWTGADCSVDCQCHGHATCSRGVGLCDACQDHTQGMRCEQCAVGSFGNATSAAAGCTPCRCNGHEDLSAGICDAAVGRCFCVDHTEGSQCQFCRRGFFGDPRNGRPCRRDCTARSLIQGVDGGRLWQLQFSGGIAGGMPVDHQSVRGDLAAVDSLGGGGPNPGQV